MKRTRASRVAVLLAAALVLGAAACGDDPEIGFYNVDIKQ